MSYPSILYRNILAEAQAGRGSGEIMAYGTTADPDVGAKTFDLTTLNARGDLAEIDDCYNGMILFFTSSGRKYLITDYVATSDLATVYEVPHTDDTGAWEIRRGLWTKDFDVDYPARSLANGRLYQYWKDQSANSSVDIYASMPNGIDDGGFELNSFDDNWIYGIGGGGTGVASINATTPILGTYDVKIVQGTSTYTYIRQTGKIDLKAGKTYGIIFKARGDGGAVSDLRISLRYIAYGSEAFLPLTFTKINAEDALGNAGGGTDNQWYPAIASSNAWEEATFTTPEDVSEGDWYLRVDQYDSTDVFMDEIYLFEVIQPDTLAVFGHNFAGGFASNSHVQGLRCAWDLQSQSTPDYETLLDMDANVQVDGNAPVYETFTAPTAIYPILRLYMEAVAGKTWEASEIWLGKRWDWTRKPNPPLHTRGREIRTTINKSRGGVKYADKISSQKTFPGSVGLMGVTEADRWEAFIDEVGYGGPFVLVVPADTNFGIVQTPIFVSCVRPPVLAWDDPIRFRVDYEFEEAF